MTLGEWYRYLNARVFFWVSERRLTALLAAYGDAEHDVLVVDTASVLSAYADRVSLAWFNTGATQRPNTPIRGRQTFTPLADYPYEDLRTTRDEPIVEVTIEEGVPDIARHVLRIERWKGTSSVSELPL
jgi:hypothetical protein